MQIRRTAKVLPEMQHLILKYVALRVMSKSLNRQVLCPSYVTMWLIMQLRNTLNIVLTVIAD